MFDKKNIFLYPASLLYGLATGIKNLFYNTGILKSVDFNIPVICVGNITIGGTGKTPHTEYIVELLKPNFKVAVLSRGYRRKTKDFILAEPGATAHDIGDEPAQMKRKFPEAYVAVEGNRVEGIKKIMELKPDTEVIILDDGFQHRRLKPGLSILLMDFSRPLKDDRLIPFGSLREAAGNAKRADIILITKTPHNISATVNPSLPSLPSIHKFDLQKLFFTTLKYGEPVLVFEKSGGKLRLDWNSFSGNGAILITGIANPGPLSNHLQRTFSDVRHLRFPDHHDFTEKDIQFITSAWNELNTPVKYLITTEKDAVRLRDCGIPTELKKTFYYIPVSIDFLYEGKEEFNKIITEYAGKNKQHN